MKRNIKVILSGCVLGLLGATSCTDGYEAEPVEKYTLEYVFSTTDSVGTNARAYLNNIYSRILSSGRGRLGGDYLDTATDDAISLNYDDCDAYKMLMGVYTSASRVNGEMEWSKYYGVIREVAIFIANIDRVPFNITYVKGGETELDANGKLKGTPLNVTMKAEARFLRAYSYFQLLKRYGGVPLMGDKIYDIEDNLELPRNTFAECVEYIVSELDAIAPDLRGLPMQPDEAPLYIAVPTREACMAMKCRVLLYAASPLFNGRTLEHGNELVGYASYDANRWQLAANCAKEFIETYGHKGTGAIDLNPNFRDVFLNFYSSANKEIIWFIQDQLSGRAVEQDNGPLGFTGNAQGNGRTNPTQNLVDAFPMKDGKKIGESKYHYDFNNQYVDRDPRFYMTVLYNGAKWLGSTLATYIGGANNPTSSAKYTRTSYYMCKFMADYTSGGDREYQDKIHPWVEYRYAEILLNYAEAMNEAQGPTADGVEEYLMKLRKRAGIEAGDDNRYGIKQGMTQAEMREFIHNERRIEMAFEEQRFYDIRRWREAEEIFEQPLRGLSITYRDGNSINEECDIFDVKWDNRRYLHPLPYSEMLKNSNLVQNPNW